MKLSDFEKELPAQLQKEGLRTFEQPKETLGQSAYSSNVTSEERLGRRVKNDIMPKLTELIELVESIYNSSGNDYYNEQNSIKDKEECLEPLKKVFEKLEVIDGEIIKYLEYLRDKIKDSKASSDKITTETPGKTEDETVGEKETEVAVKASKPIDITSMIAQVLAKK